MAINPVLRSASLLAVMLLTACASLPGDAPVWPYPDPPRSDPDWGYEPQSTPPPERAPYSPPSRHETQALEPAAAHHPSILALVEQAEGERAAGDLERATSTLERAIRIVNNDPLPWLKLAEVRFEQGNMIQAENLARRSLSFAAQGPTARAAWLLIADIKRLQGDQRAASEAQDKADGR